VCERREKGEIERARGERESKGRNREKGEIEIDRER
jgi:hypothetical protein